MRTRLSKSVYLAVIFLVACIPMPASDFIPTNPVVTLSASISKTDLVIGDTATIQVVGTFKDGTQKDVTSDPLILYVASTDAVTVSSTGIVNAISRGDARITVTYSQNAAIYSRGMLYLNVNIAGDTDKDGIPDAWETAHGLNPNDPNDAALDPDNDGLTNLEEYQHGTDPQVADTDGDGFADGLEVAMGTDPLDPASPTPTPAAPKLDANCTASIMNRTVQIGPDGTFALADVPVDDGLYRVRVVCRTPDGKTVGGQSEFIALTPASVLTAIQSIQLGTVDPIPVFVTVASTLTSFASNGQTSQFTVTATYPDGSSKVVTPRSLGTTYSTSNAAVATVGIDGLVTAVRRGSAIITARNEGAIVGVTIQVNTIDSAANDGIPDTWKRAYGFSVNDPSVAAADPDQDGLTNLQEYQRGTNPLVADTDGDGLNDGNEVARGTNPLLSDTDGDGIPDGQEIQLGTNPFSPDTDGDGLPDGLELRLGLNPLKADATTVVQGRVVNATGTPIAGASVTVFGLITATTDITGAFNIPSVPSALGTITANAVAVVGGAILSGASTATAPAGGTTSVGTIQLGSSAGTVSGVITDVRGQPMGAVQVSVFAGTDQRDLVTDSSGRYAAANLVAGTVVVVVRDPTTGLRGTGSGVLRSGQSLTINIMLAPSGRLTGTVFGRDGVTPVGAGVSVTLSNGSTQSTDAFGRYQFDFVPLGAFAVDALDTNQNHGRGNGTLSATGQTAVADIVFLGKGNITGVIKDGAGNVVSNATVNLNSRSIFGGTQTGVTDANGKYTFSSVFVGPFDVSARASIQRLGGQNSSMIDSNGQTVTTNIMLMASGSISGTVYRKDGTTKVPGAQISLYPTGLQAVTDAQGAYRFDYMPLATYTLDVIDPATGDRGRGTSTVSSQDQVATGNITLNGQGQVTVTVLDGAGDIVPNAAVSLTSQTTFSGTQTGTTSSSGTVAFPRVLAGSYSIYASDPVTQLAGFTTNTVAVGGNAAVAVRLQSTGSVRGTVFLPNGTTPASNTMIALRGQVNRSLTVNADGAFRFDTIPTGAYSLYALDSAGNILAQAAVSITLQGQIVTTNLTLVGMGKVTGKVTDPSGNPVPGVAVVVSSSVSGFTQIAAPYTDVNGTYSAMGIPVGSFTVAVNTSENGQPMTGSNSGSITADGQAVTANIALLVNVVPLPNPSGGGYGLYDANNFVTDLGQNGSLLNGNTGIFTGISTNHGAELLDVVANGSPQRFTGSATATSELSGRQIVIQQAGLANLSVTRKVYVPVDGYFTRYVELLTNPGSAPLTVNLRLTNNYSFISKVQNGYTYNREPRIVATSSGDTTLDVSNNTTRDHWIAIDDDEDVDPFLARNLPNSSEVFDGPGASAPAGTVSYNIDFSNNFGQLVTEWQSVIIPAGQTVGFLHFNAQQTLRSAALASAGRLVQLPPEALAGLTSAELASIRNFNVPSDGVSTLSALPSLVGKITGKVFAANGVTPIANASVQFQSAQPLFQRTYTASSDAAGRFSFQGALNSQGSSLPIPVAAFTLNANLSQSGTQSGPISGSFPSGQSATTIDIRFANTGDVSGTVRRLDNTVVSSGYVQAIGTDVTANLTAPIASDGSYSFTGLQPGSYTLTANVPHPQGASLVTASSLRITAGQLSQVNLIIGPTGTVTGVVTRGSASPAVNVPVTLVAANFQRQTYTDTAGRYTLFDIPVGSYALTSVDTSANTAASATVSLASNGQVLTQNLALSSGGTVTGIVTNISNQPLGGTQVVLVANNGTFTTTTDSSGRYTFNQVAPGNFALTFTYASGNLRGRATGSLPLSGQTVTVNAVLTASGTVTGTVYRADGTTPAPGITVGLYTSGYYYSYYYYSPQQSVITDAQGRYTFDLVPVGSFTLSATDPTTGDRGLANNQVNTNGETRTVNFSLNGVGKVVVTVKNASGVTVGNARVTLTSSTQFGGSLVQQTLSDGTATFTNVLAGSFTAMAADASSTLGGSTTGTVSTNATASVTIQLQPSGTILGKFFTPDGQTPVNGARVRLYGNAYDMSATTGADGSFRFDAAPLATYTLDGYDNTSRLRARKTGVVIANNGDSIVQNLISLGQATVSGTVYDLAHAASPNLPVTLQSGSVFGGFSSTVTDAQGRYSFSNILAGSFSVTATDTPRKLLGQTVGQVTTDGQTVTADIQLASNQVTLPVNLYDGNDFLADIQSNGSQRYGTTTNLSYPFYSGSGGMLLDLVQNGTASRFSGSTFGTADLNGQQITVSQVGLSTLNVTRRVYTPNSGYFSRYIETLSNPASTPVTLDVKITSGLYGYGYCTNPTLIATSSGDTTLGFSDASNPDRWAVVDDTVDTDPFLTTYAGPAIAFTFDGPGASTRVGEAAYSGSCNGQLTYTWKSVTVPAGASISLMHFDTQEVTRAAAQAAAQRLVQLPPEALTGLTANDASSIRNFVVPSDGSSTLAALPALTGVVSGKLLEADNSTPVPSTAVRFASQNKIFARTLTATTDAQGNFAFTGAIKANGATVPVPFDAFTLNATHLTTNVAATPVSGSFASGQTTATANLVFTNTGGITGVVRRALGAAVASGSVSVSGGFSTPIAADGSFTVLGVAPGTYTLTATVPNTQGSSLTGTATAVVTAGRTQTANITLQPTGTVTGIVTDANNTPRANTPVSLYNSTTGFSESTTTNSSGAYTFLNATLGRVTITATDPNSNLAASAQTTVLQDQTVTVNLSLPAYGAVQLTVKYAGGTPVASAYIYSTTWGGQAQGNTYRGATSSAGVLTLSYVPTGAVTLVAYNPNNNYTNAISGTVTAGQTTQLSLTLTGTGVVSGKVTFATGSAAANAQVQISSPTGLFSSRSTTTDSNGSYSAAQIPIGIPFTVRAYSPANSAYFRDITNNMLTADGQTLTVNPVLPALAILQVTVLKADSTPYPGINVYLTTSLTSRAYSGTTDSAGKLTINTVPEGTVTVDATTTSGANAGSASMTIQNSDQGKTVSVTIKAPLTGNVQGTTFAADGSTPLGTDVYLYDSATGNYLAGTSTDALGNYKFNNVTAGSAGLRVQAYFYLANEGYVSRSVMAGSISSPGQILTANLTLPVSVVSGTVYQSDQTTPVANPSVTATQGANAFYAQSVDAQGRFILVGIGQGDFTLTAQSNGLTGTATGTLASSSTVLSLNINLQPSGAVTGRVTAANGTAVAGASVSVRSSAAAVDLTTTADQNGAFSFANVALGNIHVQARDNTSLLRGSADGVLATANGSVALNVVLPTTGTIKGTVYTSGGTTSIPNATVTIANAANGGALGTFSKVVSADPNGVYTLSGVPVGMIGVSASPAAGGLLGIAQGTLTNGATITVDVSLGAGFSFQNANTYNLSGSNGFVYDISSTGAVLRGGKTDGSLTNAYNVYNQLYFSNADYLPAQMTGTLQQSGREIDFGPTMWSGLMVTRKVFSPANGKFVRYLDILTNNSAAPVSGTFYSLGFSGSNGTPTVVAAAAASSNQFAVINQGGSACCALGVVMQGATYTVPVSYTYFAGTYIYYGWTGTIPAGQSAAFLHFGIQDEGANAVAVTSEAKALVSLSDADALTGLTPQERAIIVNFVVP